MTRTVVITKQGVPGVPGAGGYVPGGTDVAVSDGGTGASSASAARTNLGLGNVDNTSDANKPVSTAQAAATFLVADRVWMGARDFAGFGGSASGANRGTANSVFPVTEFDAASQEGAVATVSLPAGIWATMHVDLWWLNPGAGTGDVAWRLDYHFLASGIAGSDTIGTHTVFPALGQNVVTVSRLASDVPVVGSIFRPEIVRAAAAGVDTLANDASMIGVLLVRAS
jgi:hypothetical protein